MVSVELEDELATRDADGVVEVAGLGIDASHAADVADAQLLGQRLHFVAFSIIQHVGTMRVSDGLGAECRAAKHLEGFVVGGDEDVDALARCGGNAEPVGNPPGVEQEECRDEQAPRLCAHEQDREPHRVGIQRVVPAPVEPAEPDKQREDAVSADEPLALRREMWDIGNLVAHASASGVRGPRRLSLHRICHSCGWSQGGQHPCRCDMRHSGPLHGSSESN